MYGYGSVVPLGGTVDQWYGQGATATYGASYPTLDTYAAAPAYPTVSYPSAYPSASAQAVDYSYAGASAYPEWGAAAASYPSYDAYDAGYGRQAGGYGGYQDHYGGGYDGGYGQEYGQEYGYGYGEHRSSGRSKSRSGRSRSRSKSRVPEQPYDAVKPRMPRHPSAFGGGDSPPAPFAGMGGNHSPVAAFGGPGAAWQPQIQSQMPPIVVQEDDSASVVSGASSVGTSWRSVSGGGKTKKRKHRTHLAPITGRRLALLIGADDETGCVGTTMFVAMRNFLREKKYTVESVLYQGNSAQFRQDVHSGISELYAVAQPGDAIFLYFINLRNVDQDLLPLAIIEQLTPNLRKGVRVTTVIDGCFLPYRPPYRVDHNQEKVPDPKNAGFTYLRRQAKLTTPVVPPHMEPDVVIFVGEDGTDRLSIFSLNGRDYSVFTSAFIRAYQDKDLWRLHEPPSLAGMSQGLEYHLRRIGGTTGEHPVQSRIYCMKAYDIDQRMGL